MLQISPFVMVIFGATGDLTANKLMPALYNLLKDGVLPDRFFVVGVARRPFPHQEFRKMMREAIWNNLKSQFQISNQIQNPNVKIWKKLEKNIYYQQGLFEEVAPYEKLVKMLNTFDKEIGACIARFFYLATPPQHYSAIIKHLDLSKLDEGCGQGSSKWTRILIEKPFGKDLDEAKKLEEQLSRTFEERQIYRIDHYLAKETVQNILVFRFANRLLEDHWNHDSIDHVQITLAESAGIGERGKFYEGVGAIRDVAQNHLMAMLAYITMEEPESMTAEHIRAKRMGVLSKMHCIELEEVSSMVVRGQYGPGRIDGHSVLGYRQENEVHPKSETETYVAFKLFIDNKRWKGVPFYLRTGKSLKSSMVRIDVVFKHTQSRIFQSLQKGMSVNTLTFRIQPKEGITLRFWAKSLGLTFQLEPVDMDFSYSSHFREEIDDSYQKILIDSIRGDQTLFATASGFIATWEFVTKILNGWEKLTAPKFPNYEAGSWGPKEADKLIERDGRKWMLH